MRSSRSKAGDPRALRAGPPQPPALGLRERKKAKARERISDVATALFLEQGFDAVTVSEVAKAADVSVKTVFNYFGTKEDLLFDREPEWLDAIDGLVTECRPGHGIVRVLAADVAVRWPALEFGRWDRFTEASIPGRRAFYALVEGHADLRARQRLMAERVRERLAVTIVGEFEEPGSPEALAACALIHAAYEATGREYSRQLLAGAPAIVVVDRARAVGLHGLGILEQVYAGTPLVDGPPA